MKISKSAALLGLGVILLILGFLAGEKTSFTITPNEVHLANRPGGEIETVTVQLKNISKKEIQVIGAKSSCTCCAATDLPVKAAPGETIDLSIRLGYPDDAPIYDQTLKYIVSLPKKTVLVPVHITATLIPPAIKEPAEADPTTEPPTAEEAPAGSAAESER